LAPTLLVGATALAASIAGIANGFAMDDVPLLTGDARLHSLGNLKAIFAEPYWPAPFSRDMYRPLSTLSFAVQSMLGGGAPLVFRVVSYLLYALVCVCVLRFARRLLQPSFALAVALLFAAHPVHVDVVAPGVNQAEMWVALLGVLALTKYVDIRRERLPTTLEWGGFALIYSVACLFKEHAVVLPSLMIAVEVTLVGRGEGAGLRQRASALLPGFVALAVVGVAFLALRSRVIGSFRGALTADALLGQGMGGRILTMLQVVPEWLRLLLFPARLLGDYSPRVIEPSTAWGLFQTAGALLLVALAVLAWRCRRHEPVVTFGLLFAALALAPVSNVLIPTGIVLAERTLFLPSVGFVIAMVALAQGWVESMGGGSAREEAERETPEGVSIAHRGKAVGPSAWLQAAVVGLVVLGVARSAVRHRDWRDNFTYWSSTASVAPLSSKAHWALGEIYRDRGEPESAVRSLHRAAVLNPTNVELRNQLGDVYRSAGACAAALAIYAESLELDPAQAAVRLSRVACLMRMGRLQEASEEARRVGTP
jgi:protein O-mannosyl-transferase